MKKLLLLTTLFLAFACSKDEGDGDDNSNENQTFLQRYNGVRFLDEEDGDEYYYFYDDDIFLKNVFTDSDSNDCWELREGSNNIDGDIITVKIVKNEYNVLGIAMTFEGAGETDNIEFIPTSNPNSLRVVDEGYEEDYYIINKTTTSFSSLCN